MAKDATYQPGVYRSSGGDQLNISSGGVLKFESGGTFTLTGQAITTTGAVTANSVSSTGAITGNSIVSTGTGFVHTVETVYTSVATALLSHGVSLVSSSSQTVTVTHTIVPVTGVFKTLIIPSSVTSASVAIQTTGTWDGTNSLLTVATTSGATETRITAVATSTARWRLLWVTASSNYSLAA